MHRHGDDALDALDVNLAAAAHAWIERNGRADAGGAILRARLTALDFAPFSCLCPGSDVNFTYVFWGAAMFNDLFNFGKKRTLKESVGFFIFHSGIMLLMMAVVSVLGNA